MVESGMKPKILIVDDEADIVGIMVAILGTMGYSCITASNGDEGLTILHEHADEIAAMLVDLTMPGMPGEQFIANCRRFEYHKPTAIISGNAASEVDQIAAELKVDKLHKPFTVKDFKALVNRLLPILPNQP